MYKIIITLQNLMIHIMFSKSCLYECYRAHIKVVSFDIVVEIICLLNYGYCRVVAVPKRVGSWQRVKTCSWKRWNIYLFFFILDF